MLTGSLATACFTVVIALSLFLPIGMELGRAELSSPEAFGLAQHFLYLHGALWPLVLVSLIASIATANVLYRRMRAPLIRFMRCFDAIGDGRVPAPLVLRASDYLSDEAEALNEMIAAVRRREADRAEAVARLEEAIADLAVQRVDPQVVADLHAIAKQLAPARPEDPDAVPTR
jgi:methyl-accepting chemotaxis protein